MYNYDVEHLASATVTLQNPPEMIGPVAEGLRMNVYLTGGVIHGSRLDGRFLPVGADWLTLRTDGVALLDIRATIETGDGALVYLAYQGMSDAGADGYQRFLDGDLPSHLPLRGAPRFQTAHPNYQWINRIQCHNVGEVNLDNWVVEYDLYHVI